MRVAPHKVAIVGAGLAGVSVATGLREQGFTGLVTLISHESDLPYDRPPLSKQFLHDGNEQDILLAPEALGQITLVRGNAAAELNLVTRQVELRDGNRVDWNSLVIATGARPRYLPALVHAKNVVTLRTLDDARVIRGKLKPRASLLVVGGGPIGLELAAAALKLEVKVTLVEAAPRLMGRCAPSMISDFLRDHHAGNGIDIRLNCSVLSIDERGTALLGDGTSIDADIVVVGVGVVANDELAVNAGLAADDGIFVDSYGRTTAPNVYAVGDVTRQRNPVSGRFERIETWSNAKGQGTALASFIVDPEKAAPYTDTPWFWSDQGSLRLQSAGVVCGDAQAMRGTVESGRFSLIQWQNGRVIGVASVNAAREFNLLKRLIAARSEHGPEVLTDAGVDLKSLV